MEKRSSKQFTNANGRNYLQGLFYETTLADKATVLYTLKEVDHEGYPSLRRLYLETADPTEYQFAVQHLNGWSHWQELVAAKWFKPYLDEWRAELQDKLRSEIISRIEAIARDLDNKGALQANKTLLESILSPVEAKKRGRPSKGSGEDEETRQRAFLAQIDEDAKRLGVN